MESTGRLERTMFRIIKPILIPGAIGVLALAVGHTFALPELYRYVLYGAGVAFLAIALWVVTAMVTGWNVSGP